MTKHVLIAVPLFIFAGMVMLRGVLQDDLFFLQQSRRPLPGALALR